MSRHQKLKTKAPYFKLLVKRIPSGIRSIYEENLINQNNSFFMIPVKAILSDAGNILYDDKNCTTPAYNKLSSISGIPEARLRELFKPYKNRAFTDTSYPYAQAWADLCNNLGLTQEQENSVVEAYKKQWNSMKLYPGIRETLKELSKRNIAFIVISDSPETASRMETWLKEEYQLEGITGIVSSKNVGAMKPDRKIFDTAITNYQLKPEETLFLAHDYDELKGAHDLGYRVLALNYEAEDDLSFIPENRKLNTFSDLLKKVTPIVPARTSP